MRLNHLGEGRAVRQGKEGVGRERDEPVVGDEDYCSFVAFEGFGEGLDGWGVDVGCYFVEESVRCMPR